MRCEDCNYTDPSGHADVTHSGCPNCGSERYGDQPNPLHSEMAIRDMPMPGQDDPGGNPLREGILADNGWGPGGTSQGTGRDESYASYQSHIVERQEAVIPWHMAADVDFATEQVIEPGPHTVEVSAPGQPIILQHEDPDVLDAAKATLTAKQAGLLGNLWSGAKSLAPLAIAAAPLVAAPFTGGASLAAEPEAAAAAGAAGGAEAAGATGLLGRAAGGLMKGLGMGVARGAGTSIWNDATGQGGAGAAGGAAAPGSPDQFRGIDQLSHIVGAYGDDFSSPSSQDHIPSNDTSDPEQVDGNEKNDGDNKDWEKDFSVNGVGGAQHPFDEQESGGLEALALLLPLVLHHYENGDDSGSTDPLMHALDQMLEAEAPGYKDAEPDHGAIQVILGLKNGEGQAGHDQGHDPLQKDEAGDTGSSNTLDDNDIEKESAAPPHGVLFETPSREEELLQSGAWPESDYETCPNCSRMTKMQLGGCPNCGYTVHNEPPPRLASGPRTPEQFKAVADLLRSTGREDEVQNLVDNPDQYEDELAQVQQRQPVTPADTAETPQPPMPTQEETPPGAGMPMPAPPTGMQSMGSIVEAADSITEACPKCRSHTTGLVNNDGDKARCHACGHRWNAPVEPSDGDSTHNTTTSRWRILAEDEGHDHVVRAPAADQHPRHDVRQEQDPSLLWQDTNGEPLHVGEEYLMHSQRYEIPDHIIVTGIKPGDAGITYKLNDEYGISHETEITREDKDLYQYSFEPASGADPGVNSVNDPGTEEQNPYAGVADPGQQTDLSDSAAYRGASFERGVVRRAQSHAPAEDSVEHGDPDLAWLRESGANFTMNEQRQLIDEHGVARNADKLDLSHTHYQADFDGADHDDFLFGLL